MENLFGEDDAEVTGARPEACGILVFHNGTEEALLLHVFNTTSAGDPGGVLSAVDDFCYSRHWMMHIGERKRIFLEDSVRFQLDNGAKNFLEIGSYCGYSAIGIARNFRNDEMLYCVEFSASCVEWTRKLVSFAGLSQFVTVIEGTINNKSTIDLLRHNLSQRPTSKLDLVFIDHDKKRYLSDLINLEQNGFLHSGSTVVADNTMCMGQPLTDYLEHVRNPSGNYISSVSHADFLEYTTEADMNSVNCIDAVEVSVFR